MRLNDLEVGVVLETEREIDIADRALYNLQNLDSGSQTYISPELENGEWYVDELSTQLLISGLTRLISSQLQFQQVLKERRDTQITNPLLIGLNRAVTEQLAHRQRLLDYMDTSTVLAARIAIFREQVLNCYDSSRLFFIQIYLPDLLAGND